jgi:hypothetical protein
MPMPLTTGVLLLPSHTPYRLVALAQLAERAGYDFVWLADERFFREVYASLTLCALRTERLKLGPCVTDPYSRHPALTATFAGPPAEVAAGVTRLVRSGITQLIGAPVALDGRIEATIERFQAEVMPHIRRELANGSEGNASV